jgi:hypothetical protein
MVGTVIAGILFLAILLVLLVASIRRIVIAYREERRADVVAIIGLVVVLVVFACFILTLLGPVIGPTGETILPGGAR